jgi:hypothetical protein
LSIRNESKDSSQGDEDAKPTKLKHKYSIRDVIKQIYRDRIEEEIPHKSTDKRYIGCYQRAVTKIHQNMTDDDLEHAESVMDLWNNEGVPPEMQLK